MFGALLSLLACLPVDHAMRFEHTSLQDDDLTLPRLRAFNETGLRMLVNGEKLPLAVSSFTERTTFPQMPFFWRSRLRIIQELGSGAFGEVFKVAVLCDPQAELLATLKLIKGQSEWTKNEIAYLQKMNKVSDYCTSALGSPSSFKTEEGTWILMPYLNGGDFRDLWMKCQGECKTCSGKRNCWDRVRRSSDKPLNYSNDNILALFYQLVRGVEALHANGIIHTDLKLENAMINCQGSNNCFASVIDLGLSCEPKVKGSCQASGTPSYVAPEVWKEAKGALASPKRDVWSLGVMLYLLTYSSYPPFLTDATGRAQVAYRPLQDGNIPSKQTTLDILITQMLDPDPGMRVGIDGVLALLDIIIKDDNPGYETDTELQHMMEILPVKRHATYPVPQCLYRSVDYDVGNRTFEREFCTDEVTKAQGFFRCGVCLGCNDCCKCRVLRYGKKVKEYFRMQQCM